MNLNSAEFLSLIPAYLKRREQEYLDLAEAVKAEDFARIIFITHQLKGHAPSYGFDDLGKIAVQLEQAAIEKNLSGCAACVDQYKSWLAVSR